MGRESDGDFVQRFVLNERVVTRDFRPFFNFDFFSIRNTCCDGRVYDQ